MPELTKQAESAVANLLESDEDQLYEQLGIVAQAMGSNPSVSASFQPEVTYTEAAMGPMDDVRELGKRIFRRWNKEAHKLVCGSEDIDEKDRDKLRQAFGFGEVTVAGVLTGLLVTQFGLAPAIAAVLAALIAKRFFRPAYDEFCEFWKEKLPQT